MSSYVGTFQRDATVKKKTVPAIENTTQFAMASAVGAFCLITAIIIFRDEEKKSRFIKLLTSIPFLISVIVIIIFSIVMLNDPGSDGETERRKRATKQAFLGMLIAIMAYLDLKAAPFWIIWLASYYLDV